MPSSPPSARFLRVLHRASRVFMLPRVRRLQQTIARKVPPNPASPLFCFRPAASSQGAADPMAPNTRSNNDPTPDAPADSLSRRMDAHDQLQASMHASLLALHSKVDSLQASNAASGFGSPADRGSLLRTEPLHHPPSGLSALSLDIPSFVSVDPMGWTAKAKQYFDLNFTPE